MCEEIIVPKDVQEMIAFQIINVTEITWIKNTILII